MPENYPAPCHFYARVAAGHMTNRNRNYGHFSRRRFLGTAAAAAAGALVPATAFGGPPERRSRKGADVQVGAISYSFREIPGSAEQILEYMVELDLTTVELMGGPAEQFAGAPAGPPRPRNFREISREERDAYRTARNEASEEVRQWRLSAPMDRFEALGAMYRDAGVDIDILKLGDPRWSDDEIDYAFSAARAMGARGISFEISNEAAERMGPFATKHNMLVGMHNHTQVANEGFSFSTPLSYSPRNMLNLDIGHYVAGLGTSPVPVIRQYHDRISHLHLKDRKTPENGGDNVAWGEGDTPIGEALRLLRDEGYPITAMIELEYPIPENSTVMQEMAKCAAFCRDALS